MENLYAACSKPQKQGWSAKSRIRAMIASFCYTVAFPQTSLVDEAFLNKGCGRQDIGRLRRCRAAIKRERRFFIGVLKDRLECVSTAEAFKYRPCDDALG
jgi:hypothetical protein